MDILRGKEVSIAKGVRAGLAALVLALSGCGVAHGQDVDTAELAHSEVVTHGHYQSWDITCTEEKPYEVQPRDTVYKIVQYHSTLVGDDTSWKDMPVQATFGPVEQLNRGLDINKIQAGEVIEIPQVCTPNIPGSN
jgi:hypothetical protein